MSVLPLGGRAPGHLDIDAVLDARDIGQMRAGEDALGRLGPALLKAAQEVTNRRPLHAQVGLTPVVGILGVTRPLLTHADPTREADASVDDQQAAMQTIVRLVERVPVRSAKPLDHGTRLPQPLDELAIHLRSAAHSVE